MLMRWIWVCVVSWDLGGKGVEDFEETEEEDDDVWRWEISVRALVGKVVWAPS